MQYEANAKAWMKSSIFRQWLLKTNSLMKSKRRHIILFIDNCTAHNDIPEMSNVKVVFLPPNTTSALQPLDQGIIRNFKHYYRTEVVQHILTAIEESKEKNTDPLEAMKIDVLQAMRMCRMAWATVAERTIANCFRKCGFVIGTIPHEHSVTQTVEEEPDNWQQFIQHFPTEFQDLPFSDFVNVDEEVYTCGQQSDEEIVASVMETEHNDSNSEDEIDNETAFNGILTKKDALSALNTVRQYLETKNEVPDDFFSSLVNIERHINRTVVLSQRTLHDYVPK